MITRNIIAVDPGYVSGIAWYFGYGVLDSVETSQGESPVDRVQELDLRDLRPDIIVERYDITASTSRKTRQLDAMYITGALEALAKQSGCRFVKQSRSARNRTSNQQLRRLGLYKATRDGHANDAAKHLVTYGVKWSLFPEDIMRKLVGK